MRLSNKPRPRALVIFTHIFVISLMSIIAVTFSGNQHQTSFEDVQELHTGRHLLDNSERKNCTPRSIEQFPKDAFTLQQKQQGAIILHIFFAIWLFAALAVACDDYFVSSLELICEALNLKSDVAGATFMAAGSSAPELFTSIMGVFIAQSDVGVSTIVGSAVFNILFIVSLCGLFATSIVYLSWWPLFRDCGFYCLSVIALIIIIGNGSVEWYEATIFLVMYCLYIVLMYFNERLDNIVASRYPSLATKNQGANSKTIEIEADERSKIVDSENKGSADYSNLSLGESGIDSDEDHDNLHSEDEFGPLQGNNTHSDSVPLLASYLNNNHSETQNMQLQKTPDHLLESGVVSNGNGTVLLKSSSEESLLTVSEKEDEEEWTSPLSVPTGFKRTAYWLIMLPGSILFFFTIPDCRRPGFWRKLYFLTFAMSVAWIALMSYALVWMVCAAGDTLGIPDTVMGVTLLAAGTSVPDAMSSVFVTRDGLGDMAVSNSVGSNVFDILIGLGIPWFIQTVFVGPGKSVIINSGGLVFSSITLLSTVVFLFIAVYINKMRLDKKLGLACFIVYLFFITLSVMFETNVFGEMNPPPCPRKVF